MYIVHILNDCSYLLLTGPLTSGVGSEDAAFLITVPVSFGDSPVMVGVATVSCSSVLSKVPSEFVFSDKPTSACLSSVSVLLG